MEHNQNENDGPELLEKLNEEWKIISKGQPETINFLNSSIKRMIPGN